MLENYEKELSQKRFERRIFWIVVWFFSIFLYLFFQGYYPYIKLDISGYFAQTTSGSTDDRPQIVRAFGIINIRTTPSPDSISVNGQNFINGDKVIYDYGEYAIKIEKAGYIGLETTATLDKRNPFLIEALDLLKKPVATPYVFTLKNIYPLASSKFLSEVTLTGTTHTGSHDNGHVYKVYDPESPELAKSFTS